MAPRDEVLARLRVATPAERAALAKILEVSVDDEPETVIVRLADSYRSAASEKDYRKVLVSVASEAASRAQWKKREVRDTAQVEWIEDYIYLAVTFAERPDRESLSDVEKARLREEAEQALDGRCPTPQQQSDSAVAEAVGAAVAVAVGLAVGWWAIAGVGVLGLVGWLLGPSMKKVVPATLILIHVRKREEFEAVLAREQEAA